MSRFEQSRKGPKRSVEMPQPPPMHLHHSSVEPPMLTSIADNSTYITMGVVGISLAMCIFLYKEMKGMKLDIVKMSKSIEDNEQLDTNTKSIETINEQLGQIKGMLQQMTRPQQSQAQQQAMAQAQAQQQAMAQAQAQAQAMADKAEVQAMADQAMQELDNECEGGICPMPSLDDDNESGESEKKVLNI